MNQDEKVNILSNFAFYLNTYCCEHNLESDVTGVHWIGPYALASCLGIDKDGVCTACISDNEENSEYYGYLAFKTFNTEFRFDSNCSFNDHPFIKEREVE